MLLVLIKCLTIHVFKYRFWQYIFGCANRRTRKGPSYMGKLLNSGLYCLFSACWDGSGHFSLGPLLEKMLEANWMIKLILNDINKNLSWAFFEQLMLSGGFILWHGIMSEWLLGRLDHQKFKLCNAFIIVIIRLI